MNIIKQSTANISKMDAYAMVAGRESKSMKTLSEREPRVDAYVIFEDGDSNVISILTDEGVYSTNSPTFIRDFEKLVTFLELEPPFNIAVKTGKSKNNREFVYCMPV